MRRSWQVNRRAFLGGAGALIGLPLLEAMIPGMKLANAQESTLPKRLLIVLFGTGTPEYPDVGYFTGARQGCFKPSTTGKNYAMPSILEPLSDLRDDFLVISGLHNAIGTDYSGKGGIGDHICQTWGLLTASRPTTAGMRAEYACREPYRQGNQNGCFNYPVDAACPCPLGRSGADNTIDYATLAAGVSVDQVAANAFADATPALPSLAVNSLAEADSYSNHPEDYYSWGGPTSPRPMIRDAADAFGRVFGDTTVDDGTREKLRIYKKSVVDHAKADADRLFAKLGKADQQKLDEYLTSVRDLEKRVSTPLAACAAGAPPVDPGHVYHHPAPERTSQMIDMFVLAMQCDRTRVGLLSLGGTGVTSSYDWLGLSQWNFHDDISHGAGNAVDEADRLRRLDAYQAVSTWNIQQFGALVRKLKTTYEADGRSLLESTLLLCTSEMSYGHGHSPNYLPVLVAGGGGGSAINLGRHIEVPDQPIANLYVTMLNAIGVPTSSFGNSTAALSLT